MVGASLRGGFGQSSMSFELSCRRQPQPKQGLDHPDQRGLGVAVNHFAVVGVKQRVDDAGVALAVAGSGFSIVASVMILHPSGELIVSAELVEEPKPTRCDAARQAETSVGPLEQPRRCPAFASYLRKSGCLGGAGRGTV